MLAARGIETSDEWIVERTGIRARHFADDGVNASDLALHAARHALEAAGRGRGHRPDHRRHVHAGHGVPVHRLHPAAQAGHRNGCAAFDVQAVCSGFVYALTVADAMIRTGSARCALVIGAEVFSRILDFNDRTTCVLFGDGAGAVVLEASDDARHPGQRPARRRPPRRHPVRAGHGVRRPGAGRSAAEDGRPGGVQAGGRRARERARAVLAKAGRSEADIDWLIPHQANIRIMQARRAS
jgi:3-oxoacyl-[acyl-carrier-protein] synthase III